MKKTKLIQLKNVGKAFLHDLQLLEIHTIEQLAQQNPTELFHRLERITEAHQDFCVWDVFASIIHEAQTGEESVWWDWTSKRKELQKQGLLSHAI